MSANGKTVAARYRDGRVVKGWTADFQPRREIFHIRTDDGATPTKVMASELKALFFVRDLAGNPSHEEDKSFPEGRRPERKVWITFEDGEELAGWATGFASKTDGFYMTPTDPDSNLERAYVFRAAVTGILSDAAAEEAARNHEPGGAERAASGSWSID